LYLRGNSDQVLDFYALWPKVPSAHFHAKIGRMHNEVNCASTTEYLDRQSNGLKAPEDVHRLTLNDEERVVCITDYKDGTGQIANTESQEASVETILELAKKAAAIAQPKDEPEEVLASGVTHREVMYIPQPLVVPIIGRLARVGADALISNSAHPSVSVKAEINAGYHRLYGSYKLGYKTWQKYSNIIEIGGVNHQTYQRAEFKFAASPLGDTEIAVLESSLLVESGLEDGLHARKDVIVQGHKTNLRRVHKERKAGEEPRKVGNYPASLETIVQLAQLAVRLINAEEA
jgi:hypothetical protein